MREDAAIRAVRIDGCPRYRRPNLTDDANMPDIAALRGRNDDHARSRGALADRVDQIAV